MLKNFISPNIFISLSIIGGLAAIICALVSALAYRGKKGERFSPLNHFISELGEVGVSRLAWVFNLGLILTGISLIPACIIFGLLLPGVSSKIGLVAGVVAAASLSMVGVFPMNHIKPHGKVAITFFRGGLLMVLAFSASIALQSPANMILPRGYSLAGLPAILAFGGFLILMLKASKEPNGPLQPIDEKRPRVWIMPIVEWTIFVTILLWFLLIALGLSI